MKGGPRWQSGKAGKRELINTGDHGDR